jgi:hypothetical protein
MTLDEVFKKAGTNREQYEMLIRRGLVPRVDAGDHDLINKVWKLIEKHGLEEEYGEFHMAVKRDFIKLPIRYV